MIQGKIYITGEIDNTTLLDCIKQVKSQPQATEFLVVIDSNGGFVSDGKDVYNYLKNLNQPVTTFTRKAYSIASMIFMAGSSRIIPEGAENAIMIHLPWINAQGNQTMISKHLDTLKATEDEMVDFYSTSIEIDKSTIHSLLEKTTYLNATQAVEMGFATEIQPAQLAVARLHNNKEEKEESLMNKLNAKLDAIYNMVVGKSAIKAELVLQDSTGVEIVFPDLTATDTPVLEDKATIDGKPAEGEYTLPDGTLFTFAAGMVSEIETQKEEDTEPVEPLDAVSGDTKTTDAPVEDKDKMIADLKKQIEDLKAQLESTDSAKASEEKLVEIIEMQANKQAELENKFQVLAKQIGSDFQPSSKENKTSVKASFQSLSRAAQILNS